VKLGKYIGFLFGLFFLALIFKELKTSSTDLGHLKEQFFQVHYWYILPSLLPYGICFMLRAVRWQLMLRPVKRISLSSSFSTIMIAWASNNVLPLRMGEIVRTYVIGQKENITVSAALATIVIERIIDGLSLVGICALFFLFETMPSDVIMVEYIASGIFIALLLGLLFFHLQKELCDQIIARSATLLPGAMKQKVPDFFETFRAGIACLRFNLDLVFILGLTMIIWLGEASMYAIIFKSCGLTIPFYGAILAMAIVNIGLVVPAAPGFVGNFQYFAIIALKIFGISPDKAFIFSWIIWLAQIPSLTLTGMVYLFREKFTLKDLKHVRIVEGRAGVEE
jgi:uncharacterized protein (TIRG00374 family)